MVKTQRRKADEPKLEQAGLKLPPEHNAALERIALAKADPKNRDRAINRQFLLRRAAEAIIRFADKYGDKRVPLEMEIQPAGAEWLMELIAASHQPPPPPPPTAPPSPSKSPRK
jgi:hypothetical protein